MDEHCQISIIIPIYNSELHLESCLKSALSQDFTLPYEIIVVNNGSTDNSETIVKSFAHESSKIKYIYVSGLTVNESRLLGLKNAKGKYICFLDSDDFIRFDFLKILYDSAIKTKAEVTCCSYVRYLENNKILKNVFGRTRQYNNYQAINSLLLDVYLRGYMPMKLYDKNFLDTLNLPISKHLTIYEDYLFNFVVFMNATKIQTISDPLYYYRLSTRSVTSESTLKRPSQRLKCAASIRYLCEQEKDKRFLKAFYKYKWRFKLSFLYDVHLLSKKKKSSFLKEARLDNELWKKIINKQYLSIEGEPWEKVINDIK